MENFMQDEEVIIHSTGDNKEYRGKIAGIANVLPDKVVYIVEMVDRLPKKEYPYSHITINEECLKRK